MPIPFIPWTYGGCHERRELMTALARWCFRHRLIVSFSWILALVVATMLGGATGSKFNDGFSLPGTGSTKAMELLTANVPAQAGDVDTIVWQVTGGPAVPERITSMLGQVAHSPHVTGVSPATTAADGRISFARVQFDQAADKVPVTDYKAVIKTVQAARTTGLDVQIGGPGIELAQ